MGRFKNYVDQNREKKGCVEGGKRVEIMNISISWEHWMHRKAAARLELPTRIMVFL
jgi:hypothetical protein